MSVRLLGMQACDKNPVKLLWELFTSKDVKYYGSLGWPPDFFLLTEFTGRLSNLWHSYIEVCEIF